MTSALVAATLGGTARGMTMRIFGLKSCDTTRRALKDLRAAGHDPAFVDVRADGVPGADLDRILLAFGERAVNRASATWRGLSEPERDRPLRDLLADHPTLMKRPVVDGAVLTLGWGDDAKAAHLGSGAGGA